MPTRLSDIPDTTRLSDIPETPAQTTEEEISKRPSAIASLGQSPIGQQLSQHPFVTALKGALAPFEIAEGLPADVGLALQRHEGMKDYPIDVGKLGQDIKKTVTGERPAQYGDIFRASGVPFFSSEPVASTLGLVLASSDLSPSGALSKLMTSGIKSVGKLEAVNQLVTLAAKHGEDAVASITSFMTRLPKGHILDALHNPTWLDEGWLNEERNAVKSGWKEADPIIKSNKAGIDPKPVFDNLEKTGIQAGKGVNPYKFISEDDRAIGIEGTERKKLEGWLAQISSWADRNPAAREILRTYREMDNVLTPVYKKVKAGAGIDTTNFQGVVRQLRYAVRSAINDETAPGLNKLINRDAVLSQAENVHNSFTQAISGKMAFGGLFRALPLGLTLKATGMPAKLAAPVAYASTFGPLAGKAIQEGASFGEHMSGLPAMVSNLRTGFEESSVAPEEDTNE